VTQAAIFGNLRRIPTKNWEIAIEAFVTHPWSAQRASSMFRSGGATLESS